MWQTLKNMIPAPIAAPESEELKAARYLIILALSALAIILTFWSTINAAIGHYAVAIVIGLAVYLLIKTPIWVMAKNKADNDHLMRDDK